jgi:hypothetical protein
MVVPNVREQKLKGKASVDLLNKVACFAKKIATSKAVDLI